MLPFEQFLSMPGPGPLSGFGLGVPFFLILIIWSLVWKGMALWRSARRGEKPWFVALLIINTVGILEILYIYVFSKDKAKPAAQPEQPQA